MIIIVKILNTETEPIKQERIQRASTIRNTRRFTAEVNGDPLNAGVLWEVSQGGGEIDQRGVFIPPYDRAVGKSIISAISLTDRSKRDTAIVRYTDF